MLGFKATRAFRAITDVIQAGSVSDDHVKQALRDGLHRGLIRRSEVKKIKGISFSAKERLGRMISELQ